MALTRDAADAGSREAVAKPKTCFVIMPFSKTRGISKEQWTAIFEEVIRPAVQEAGLNYVCRRSSAQIENITSAIVRDLAQSEVVIADITDLKPNVMYELGVRHALRRGTILIAQERTIVPFDLRVYPVHRYGWKTQAEKDRLRQGVRELLLEIERDPGQADSPVADYLEQEDLYSPGIRVHRDFQSAPSFRTFSDPALDLVFTGGPNLSYVKETCREYLYDKLALGCRVHLMIMDPQSTEAVRLIHDYAFTANFAETLQAVASSFGDWLQDAEQNGWPLAIRVTSFLPISFHFVDPDRDAGMMRIIPIPPRTSGFERPPIDIPRRVRRDLFGLYYSRFKLLWETAPPLQV